MQLGDTSIDLLDTGTFLLDGGAMFGVVPKVLWHRACPADDRNRITMGLNCMLIRRPDATVVVDTGIGQHYDEVFVDRYGADLAAGIVPALAGAGVTPEQVTHVILTHLHFDHAAGNCVRSSPDADWQPAFPNARFLMPEVELANAKVPDGRSQGSYWPHTWESVAATNQVDTFHDEELLPGVRARHAPGHTAGHHVVTVDAGDRRVCFVADLLPTEHHLRSAWIMAYDLYPAQTLETKQTLVAEAIAEHWLLAFEHSTTMRFATVGDDGCAKAADG